MPWLGIGLAILAVLVAGCSSHELPPLSPVRGQTVGQQAIDAKDCASQVESAARAIGVTRIAGWSDEERYTYLACMEGRGYAGAK
jgi:hypothetical protein